MIDLRARPPRRRNETRDLTRPIEARLNKLPGVRVVRNNPGLVVSWHRRLDASAHPFAGGLGVGSADLVGMVTCEVVMRGKPLVFGRAFCLEVKSDAASERKSRSASRRTTIEDQERWARSVRLLGGFCCVVHSLEEACAAVLRCRMGASE